jgi:hypothetical protein
LAASLKLNCAKTGLAARVISEASTKPREIFIQTSSCAMKTPDSQAQSCRFDRV